MLYLMGIHIIFLSPILALTFVIIFLKFLSSVSPGLGNVGRGVDIFKGELKRVLVGGLPWEDLQGVLI